MNIIAEIINNGRGTLNEYQSKQILANYGIPVTQEILTASEDAAVAAAEEIGYPVVLKGSGEGIDHKTEKGLVKLDVASEKAVRRVFRELTDGKGASVTQVLVQEMIKGDREFLAGLTRDPQFGPCVVFGLGGIFSEVLQDVAFKITPLERRDAMEMMHEIRAVKMLDAFRGKPAVNHEIMADILMAVGQIGMDHPGVKAIDINPLKLINGQPIAVDALFVLE